MWRRPINKTKSIPNIADPIVVRVNKISLIQRFDLVAHLSELKGNRWQANSETGHEADFFLIKQKTNPH